MTAGFSLSAYALIGFLVGVVRVDPLAWYREYRFFKDRGVSQGHWREWIWVPVSVVLWPIVIVLLFFRWVNEGAIKTRVKRERIRSQQEHQRLKALGWEEEWIYPEIAESRAENQRQQLRIIGHARNNPSKEATAYLASVERMKVIQEWARVSGRETDSPSRLVNPELNRRRKQAWESQQEINAINHAAMISKNLANPALSDQQRQAILNLRQCNQYHDPLEDDPVHGPVIKQVMDEVIERSEGRRLRCHSLWFETDRILRERHGITWFSPSRMNPGTIYD